MHFLLHAVIFGSVKFKNLKIYSGWLSMQTILNKLKVCAVVKSNKACFSINSHSSR